MTRQAFEEKLRALHGGGSRASLGKLHVISLDQVAAAFGGEWARLRQRAMLLAEHVLAQNLNRGDAFLIQDDKFLVVFAGLDANEAAVKASFIARRIREKLMGVGTGQNGHALDISAQAVDIRHLFAPGGALRADLGDEQALSGVFAQHGTRAEAGRPMPAPVVVRRNPPPPKREAVELGQSADDLVRKVLRSVEIGYVPVWSLSEQQVLGYRLYPSRAVKGRTVSGEAILVERAYDPLVPYLDLFMLKTAVSVIDQEQHQKSMMLVPIHMGTFLNEGRVDFLSYVQSLNTGSYRDALVYELIGVNDDTSRAVLEGALRVLSGSAKYVILRCETEAENVEYVRDSGVRHLGISLHAAFVSPFGKKTIRKYISHFGNDCLRRGFHTFIWGIDTRLDGELAVGSGYALLAGNLFGRPREWPGPSYPLNQRKVFAS